MGNLNVIKLKKLIYFHWHFHNTTNNQAGSKFMLKLFNGAFKT